MTNLSRVGERVNTSHRGTGWQDQRARVGRWHKRLTAISFGIPTDVSKAEALDDVYAFFMNCCHLRDWNIKSGFRQQAEVDAFVGSNLALSLCRDICNGLKHFRIEPARASTAPELVNRNHVPVCGCRVDAGADASARPRANP